MFRVGLNQNDNLDLKTETNKKLNINWDIVESSLAEGTYSGYKSAIIEMEKIFREIAKNKKLKWQENEEELPQNIARRIIELEKLKYARRIYFKILHLRNFNPTYFETRNAIEGYYLAIEDLENFKQSLFATRVDIEIFAGKILKILAKVFLFLILISGIIVLFADNSVFQSLFIKLLNISRFFIYKIMLYIAIAAFVSVAIIFIIKIMKRKKQKE